MGIRFYAVLVLVDRYATSGACSAVLGPLGLRNLTPVMGRPSRVGLSRKCMAYGAGFSPALRNSKV